MKTQTIEICIHRPGKSIQITDENLVSVDDLRLRTFKQLNDDVLPKFRNVWVQAGLLLPDCGLAAVRKTLFFKQYFQVMELVDAYGVLLGTYCDISSPLVKENNKYHFTDWFLDVWLSTKGVPQVLDEDEFEQAIRDGLLNEREWLAAKASLAFILGEINNDRFPSKWLQE